MQTSDFQRLLKKLNPTLEVIRFENSKNFPGLHYRNEKGEKLLICSVAYNGGWIKEYTEYDEVGHITHPGWRRAIYALLKHEITTQEKVRKVIPGFFLHQNPKLVVLVGDPIGNAINKRKEELLDKKGTDAFSKDDIAEIASQIESKESDAEKNKLEMERWNLKKWHKNGGAASDKPAGFDLK